MVCQKILNYSKLKNTEITVDSSMCSYTIKIENGLRYRIGKLLHEHLGNYAQTTVIVSNSTVWKLYGADIQKSLKREGIQYFVFLIDDGEKYKSLQTAKKLWDYLINQRIERHSTLLAVGGGVVGDLTGFVAATYLRGIPYVQFPTTLLAQIDSSIGGKTAVNHSKGKNLIGVFHQPSLVLADIGTLSTLPQREFNSALYEALKYGVVQDINLLKQIERKLPFKLPTSLKFTQKDLCFLTELVKECCSIKASIVAKDERDEGERKILNFGHTVGHALETVTRYKKLTHGEAVGYGMITEFQLAVSLGFCSQEDYEYFFSVITRVGKLPELKTISLKEVVIAIKQDKKSVSGSVEFFLPKYLGKVFGHDSISEDVLIQVLRSTLRSRLKNI